MRKLIALIVLGLIGFYAAWPAWSGYRIKQAFDTDDKALLESKVDFASVRQSLRPVMASEVTATIERAKRDAGPLGSLIAGQLKDETVQRLADGALATVITPENVLRVARQGGNLREAVTRVMAEQLGRPGASPPGTGAPDAGPRLPGGIQLPGGLPGGRPGTQRQPPAPPVPAPAGAPPAPKDAGRKLGPANIKSFAIDGPLGFSVGVARDAEAPAPDIVAHLAFRDFDWKVVGVTPRLPR